MQFRYGFRYEFNDEEIQTMVEKIGEIDPQIAMEVFVTSFLKGDLGQGNIHDLLKIFKKM